MNSLQNNAIITVRRGIQQLLFFNLHAFDAIHKHTLLYGLIYGILLILSQWMFTIALRKGNTSICTVIYSLGLLSPAITGICFGGAYICNTLLAGRMKSAVFFPVQNISTILLTTVLGLIIFKEKITVKTIAIVMLGIITVVIFCL